MHSSFEHRRDYNVIIFDLDGVVIDSCQDIIDSAKYVMNYYGYEIKEDSFIRSCIGGGAKNLLGRCMEFKDMNVPKDILLRFKEYYFENCANKTTLYPGVKEILEYLACKGKTIALATYKVRSATLKILDSFGITYYFSVIVTADDVKNPKPHRECVDKILTKLSVLPEKAVIIGDTKTDISTGKNAGIDTCGVLYGFGTEEEVTASGPDYVIKNLSEIKRII
jgi:phosphoglycolate phosphatase